MIKKAETLILTALMILSLLTGCSSQIGEAQSVQAAVDNADVNIEKSNITIVTPTAQVIPLRDGFSAVSYYGDYGFDVFLEQGGAGSDAQVAEFLNKNLLSGEHLEFQHGNFGCSTLAVHNANGDALFGRNFDWQACNALVVQASPQNGYTSISTVNMDFLSGYGNVPELLPDAVRTIAALYAPMDGMNEKGLCVAVLVIQDAATIHQDTGKPSITTTTAMRLLLDKAASVEEAIDLLEQYDMHSSGGMMVHFALADAEGRSVVVEYINNEMSVIETPAVTNFYLAEGEKNGIGTAQSHTRYDIIMDQLNQTPVMSMEQVRDTLDSVSKDNFGEFESTEWSTVYNQTSGEVHYYHREDYEHTYAFKIFN